DAAQTQDAGQEQAANEYHPVRGIFLGYDDSERRITVAHEAIPEVMMAMRMHLALPEDEPAPRFAVGDKVAFEMFSRVEAGRTWYARKLEALPADTALVLPEKLREQIEGNTE
ncbi:MAG TPA: copper-binding protein, partial [Halomonas sp.]|nr:copper-binding protein [Halomonas sp.]